MARLPEQFREDYENRGDTFFAVAQVLVENHDQQFTQADLTAQVDVSQSRVSDFTTKLTDDEWVTRHENQTTFQWDSEQYNPAEREAADAVFGLYRDLWAVIELHSRTSTTLWSIFGLAFFITAAVLLAFYLAVMTGLFGDSAVAPVVYLVLGSGLIVSGLIITAFAPLQAFMNRVIDRIGS